MESKKLSKEIKGKISYKLALKYANNVLEIEKKSKAIKEKITEQLENLLPDDVKAFMKKYKKFVGYKEWNVYLRSFCDDNKDGYNFSLFPNSYLGYVFVPYGLIKLDEKRQDGTCEIDCSEYIKKILPDTAKELNALFHLSHEAYNFKRKCECTLEDFKTTNQLKNEFPEAFDVYQEIEFGEVSKPGENRCDTVENLRAKLSAKKS